MSVFGARGYRDHGPDFADSLDMENAGSRLYGRQGQVPRLPVPPLEHTMGIFLESVKPLVTAEEFVETKRKVDEFVKSGQAEILQNRLKELDAKRSNSSWFIKAWNELAYLGYRDSVVWNVSYFLQLKDEPAFAMSPTRRAARFVYHSLFFRELVVSGDLDPDMRKKVPMSNSQYKYMFNACRMPGDGMDVVRTYDPSKYRHIVVARKNRFYSFDVLDSKGSPKSIREIEVQLGRIVSMADRVGIDEDAVGVLTAGDRDVWFEDRKRLVSGVPPEACELNRASLEKIESSIIMVCFDDTSPTTREEIGRALIHSDGRNRFWDKSIQVVFFENGRAGFVGEHAMMDGLTTTRLVNFTLERMFGDSPEICFPSTSDELTSTACLLDEPTCQRFALSKSAKDAIATAGRVFDDIISTKELKVLMFHGYGKEQIKKFGMSPDAYAQMVIQLAYYKTFGVFRGTYESTQTRSFLHGRTEVTRSVSTASVEFCQAMTSGKALAKECHEKLLAATKAHSAFTSKAANGMGCDRHLLGLKLMLKKGERIPELYSDIGYSRSGTWAISTSGLVGELMDGWGFGEVVPHGVGIGYSVQNNRLRFTVSSRHKEQEWAARMVANLEASLLEMRDICEANKPKSKL
mmetsp:Transcript_11984/g.19507  ORF Transcript_11984/g.19507 Transcript_11984/m.19507 type:complete len:633 (-) Transcript_11984:1471-3369(-)|eukprot:CAMPEP_0203744768 /NCGR_PEP_ID=MMETSP0098-20131031/735_1 /ASSEMBLY_ACC=CAM_ASM_000208 /TAXON_ID=96639 /ORGANISM=" , Strain NY0313808BC1" /LENGTH=632 /DNA_ID=CAMNT_0050632381 /DNA_START=179 /DNA_END=2077 /DNA_ORIENTATION=-